MQNQAYQLIRAIEEMYDKNTPGGVFHPPKEALAVPGLKLSFRNIAIEEIPGIRVIESYPLYGPGTAPTPEHKMITGWFAEYVAEWPALETLAQPQPMQIARWVLEATRQATKTACEKCLEQRALPQNSPQRRFRGSYRRRV